MPKNFSGVGISKGAKTKLPEIHNVYKKPIIYVGGYKNKSDIIEELQENAGKGLIGGENTAIYYYYGKYRLPEKRYSAGKIQRVLILFCPQPNHALCPEEAHEMSPTFVHKILKKIGEPVGDFFMKDSHDDLFGLIRRENSVDTYNGVAKLRSYFDVDHKMSIDALITSISNITKGS